MDVIIQTFTDQTVEAVKGFTEGLTSGTLEGVINGVAAILWSPFLIFLCLGAGIYFSCRTRFLQLRKVKKMVKLLFGGSDSEKGVSSFQAFALAVAGRVGTGNIMGVATALFYGGPGALFWMWTIAFLGAGSAFVEATLAQIYKEEIDGEYRGGPAFYFSKRGWHVYAMIFSIFTIIAMAFFLPGVQSNSIAVAVNNGFGIDNRITIAVVVALLGIIILGGTKSLGKAAEVIVPFMSGIYILFALVIILANFGRIPEMFSTIFSSAFGLNAAIGGTIGLAISWGVKRGVFSNEAGQGTAPHVAAAAEVSHPAKQGLVQAFSVYFDTIFVCSATGFMLLMTGMFNTAVPGTMDPNTKVYQVFEGYNGYSEAFPNISVKGETITLAANQGHDSQISGFTQAAVDTLIKGFGQQFVAIAIFFFAFTTLMALYYYAETNLEYVFRKTSGKVRKYLSLALKIVYLGITAYFGLVENALAWSAADIGVGVMAWLNIIGILLIAKPAFIALTHFEKAEKEGTDDVLFNLDMLTPEERVHFKGSTFWSN